MWGVEGRQRGDERGRNTSMGAKKKSIEGKDGILFSGDLRKRGK
jgi:hypothetical protein